MSKKITKATLKKFVRENRDKLFINTRSRFSGMIDGCEIVNNGFKSIIEDDKVISSDYTLGIKGVWLVGGGRDYFREYNDPDFTGIETTNCCGCFVLAVRNEKR